MSDDCVKPDVEKIVDSIRQGLEDNSHFDESQHKMDALQKLKSSLRKAAASAEVLGRCDGSMRGKICKKLAWFAKPVVEQMDMHNAAVIKTLNMLNETQSEIYEERIKRLEAEIESLKSGSKS
jgi:hypothetical protein